MTLFPSIGVPTPVAPLEALSRDLFDLDFASVEWSPDSGGFVSASGQVGTFARGATLGSVIDVNGEPYTAVNAQPAWEQRDWDADAVRESFGLRMGSADKAVKDLKPQFLAFVESAHFHEAGTGHE